MMAYYKKECCLINISFINISLSKILMMKNRGPVGLGLDQFLGLNFINWLVKTYYYIYN